MSGTAPETGGGTPTADVDVAEEQEDDTVLLRKSESSSQSGTNVDLTRPFFDATLFPTASRRRISSAKGRNRAMRFGFGPETARRRRRHSSFRSATRTSSRCAGTHDEPDPLEAADAFDCFGVGGPSAESDVVNVGLEDGDLATTVGLRQILL